MTLSEVSTLLPPPEGWAWEQGGMAYEFLLTTPEHAVCGTVCARHSDTDIWLSFSANDRHYQEFPSRLDLPAAYLRALTAVGLAPDAEKEDMRRRLTWTSEVPTEPGVYVVGRGVKPYDGSIMFRRRDEDGGKMERPWVDAFGLPWTDEQMKGRRFFALDNLKETP